MYIYIFHCAVVDVVVDASLALRKPHPSAKARRGCDRRGRAAAVGVGCGALGNKRIESPVGNTIDIYRGESLHHPLGKGRNYYV